MEKRLSEFSIGETGVIRLVGGDGKIRRRLFELTLRKSEADVVTMEV